MNGTENEKRPRSYSVCLSHAEAVPLVMSFEVANCEWLCMECGARSPMLGPASRLATDALHERWTDLRQQYLRGERPSAAAAVRS